MTSRNHMINPTRPLYNQSPLKNTDSSVFGQTKSPFRSTGNVLNQAAQSIVRASNTSIFTQQSKTQLPNSVNFALEDLEQQIVQLQLETSQAKKEVSLLKTSQDTILHIANTQHQDVQRYLEREIRVLKDIIPKQHSRQKQESQRLQGQVAEIARILAELNLSREECIRKQDRVERVMGHHTDTQNLKPLLLAQFN